MPRYWYRTDSGELKAEAPANPRPVGHSGYALTPDLADLPAPIAACRWDGSQVVVDVPRLSELKARLRQRVEESALLSVSEAVLTTPWGDLRVRRDDIDIYQMIGFTAIYAQQTSAPFSVQLRRADDSPVTVNALQFIRLLALIGERMGARLAARDTKLDQLAAATAEQLKSFEP